jgi:hypothetical protein
VLRAADSSSGSLVEKQINGGNLTVPGNDEISPGYGGLHSNTLVSKTSVGFFYLNKRNAPRKPNKIPISGLSSANQNETSQSVTV